MPGTCFFIFLQALPFVVFRFRKPTYNNSKAAMISFTKSLADEVIKEGIRVNSIAIGAILHSSSN